MVDFFFGGLKDNINYNIHRVVLVKELREGPKYNFMNCYTQAAQYMYSTTNSILEFYLLIA